MYFSMDRGNGDRDSRHTMHNRLLPQTHQVSSHSLCFVCVCVTPCLCVWCVSHTYIPGLNTHQRTFPAWVYASLCRQLEPTTFVYVCVCVCVCVCVWTATANSWNQQQAQPAAAQGQPGQAAAWGQASPCIQRPVCILI